MNTVSAYRRVRASIERKPIAFSSFIFIFLLTATAAVTFQMYRLTLDEERRKAFDIGDAARDQLEITLHYGLSATQTVALMIENKLFPSAFEPVAEKIMRAYPFLHGIELGPGGVVSNVYPVDRNKAALHFDILGDSIQQAEANEAIRQKKLIFAGPLNLVQGGVGVVGRLPVYESVNGVERFWGFSLVVIRLDSLLSRAHFDELNAKGYLFQLRRFNPPASTVDTFTNKHLVLADPVTLPVSVPNGHWDLSIAPLNGWQAGRLVIVYPAAGTLISFLIALFVWYAGKQPEKLARRVDEKTDELRKSEEKFRTYVENSPNIVTIVDPGGTIGYLNKTESSHGTGDFIGKSIFDFIPAYQHPDVRRALDSTLRSHTVSSYFTMWTAGGETVWYENRVALLFPFQPESRLLITSINITERKKAEQEVRMNQDRLNRAEEVALFGNWELSLTDSTMRASEGARRLYGIEENEVPLQVAQSVVLPEYRLALDAALQNLVRHSIPYEVEFKIQRRSDRRIIDIYSKAEFDAGSNIVFGTIQDITKRKEAEERNRVLISSLPDLLFVLNREGRFLDWHAPESFPPWLPPDQFLGKTIDELLPAGLLEIVKPKFDAALRSGEMQTYQYSFERNDGVRFYEARFIRFGGDKIMNIVRDVTDRVRAENDLKTLNEELETRVLQRTVQLTEANRELEAFSYSVSHDLRAPLRAIDSFSAMLAEEYGARVDDEGRRLISVVRSSIKKMDLLINGLLTLSRIGRSELHYSAFSMEKLVRQVIDEISDEDARRRYMFVVAPLPDVAADEILLKQVWNNLISNAMKYTSGIDQPVIKIGGTVDSGSAVYSIADNGIGFDPVNAGKLFGIFQRLHSDDRFQGLGVGLSIVQRIVNRHGGTVRGEGSVNAGAAFFFSLPLRKISSSR